jgi:hypothetical protein
LDLSVCCGGEENSRGKQQDSSGRTHQNSHNCLLCTLRPLAGANGVETASDGNRSGPKAVPADRAIVACKKTCSETVEQIIGGRNKLSERAGSADEYANRNAELLVRAYHLGPRRSLYCACYAMPLRAPFPLFT